MNSIYLILMIITGVTGIALIGSIFFCWIPGAHFRKVYHVGVVLCEFLFLNFFIAGSIASEIHSGLSMLIVADIFLLCARILHRYKSYISEAIYFLILIFIHYAGIGLLFIKETQGIACGVFILIFVLSMYMAYLAEDFLIILSSSLLWALFYGVLVYMYGLTANGYTATDAIDMLILLGNGEILLTVFGSLLRVVFLRKKGLIRKSLLSKKVTLIVSVVGILVTGIGVSNIYTICYEKTENIFGNKTAKTYGNKRDIVHYYAVGNAKIYSEPDKNSKYLDELADGQQISYSICTDEWVCIKYKNAKKAYVERSDVSDRIPDGRYFLDTSIGYGSGYYRPGQKIKLECTEKIAELKYFHKWSSNVEGIIEDPYACTTEITMPSEKVNVKPVGASWKPVEIRTESLKEELTDFTVKINGKSYSLPLGEYEFGKEGWKEDLDNVDDDDPDPPPESWIDFKSWDDPSRIKCKTKETEDNVYITGFTNQDIEKSDLQVEFPGGIVLGKSTRDDVRKVYGANSYDVYFDDADNYLGYWRELGVGISFGFGEDGTLKSFLVQNAPKEY